MLDLRARRADRGARGSADCSTRLSSDAPRSTHQTGLPTQALRCAGSVSGANRAHHCRPGARGLHEAAEILTAAICGVGGCTERSAIRTVEGPCSRPTAEACAGETLRYAVESQRQVAAADSGAWGEILSSDVEQDTITLITCGGQFNTAARSYLDRIVVRAVRI